MSTVGGRVGLVDDRWLVFAKLGGGWVHSDATVNIPGSPIWNGSSTNGGWLIGGGIEYGFKAHWTVKLEYDYLALSSWNSATVPAVGLSRDVQMIKAGINYKFESGLPPAGSSWREPVVPARLQKTKTCRRHHRTRSRISSACRSRATPISTLGRSIARRKYSTFSQSCRCT